MKLHYKGKFDGNYDLLPTGELEKHKNAVKFKEFDDMNKFMIIMNIVSGLVMVLLGVIFVLRVGGIGKINFLESCIGMLLACVSIYPHELLHAICFKGDVNMYLTLGGAFVCGTENMSKSHFIFLCMLPNIVFGFIPFTIFLFFPQLNILGVLGLTAIAMGVGDYYNVFNALTQMPKGARCFMEKQNSYWYMPDED